MGRLTEQKDHLTILKSMKILNNTNVNFQLLIIGKGNLESFLFYPNENKRNIMIQNKTILDNIVVFKN